jgi:hypothetical protein
VESSSVMRREGSGTRFAWLRDEAGPILRRVGKEVGRNRGAGIVYHGCFSVSNLGGCSVPRYSFCRVSLFRFSVTRE